MTQRIDRRSFLKGAGAAGAALITAPYFVPSRAFGANERVVMALVGAGGRGRHVMTTFQKHGAVFAAVCDIFEPNRKEGVKIASKDGNKVAEFEDYRDLLDKQKDINAVLIATPEHQHGMQLIDVVHAGLDSYCEKPMSHSIAEGVKIVNAVSKTDRIVQIGMQRRSSAFVRKGKEVIDSGKIGPVHFVRVKWDWSPFDDKGNVKGFFNVNNDPLPEMTPERWKLFCKPSGKVKFEPKKFRHWRWFWPFSGGNITDQGTHLMDVVQWYMSKEKDPVTPLSAECFGDVYFLKGVETPDVFSSIYTYPNFTATWSLNYTTSYQDSWSIEFMGEKGTMVVDDMGYRVFEEPWKPSEGSTLVSGKKPVIDERGGLDDFAHVGNFLECLKSRQEPNAPVLIGHRAVCGPHLANVAYHRKERAHLNPEATRVNRELF